MNWYWFLLGLFTWEMVLIVVSVWRTEQRISRLVRQMEGGA